MKICPFCAEEIKSEAKKCKHCGSFINEDASNKYSMKEELLHGAEPLFTRSQKGASLFAITGLIIVYILFKSGIL